MMGPAAISQGIFCVKDFGTPYFPRDIEYIFRHNQWVGMGFLCNAFLNMINTEPKDKMKSKIICGNTYYDGCLFPKFDLNNRNDIISVIYQYHGLKTSRSPT